MLFIPIYIGKYKGTIKVASSLCTQILKLHKILLKTSKFKIIMTPKSFAYNMSKRDATKNVFKRSSYFIYLMSLIL